MDARLIVDRLIETEDSPDPDDLDPKSYIHSTPLSTEQYLHSQGFTVFKTTRNIVGFTKKIELPRPLDVPSNTLPRPAWLTSPPRPITSFNVYIYWSRKTGKFKAKIAIPYLSTIEKRTVWPSPVDEQESVALLTAFMRQLNFTASGGRDPDKMTIYTVWNALNRYLNLRVPE